MKKKLLIIILCLLFICGCNNQSSNNSSNTNNNVKNKDRVSGNYVVYGIKVNVDASEASRTVITNVNAEFNNGVYNISYCIDDMLNTSSDCDNVKLEGTGTYTINEDTLLLHIGENKTTDMQTRKILTNDGGTNRSCKIIDDNQTIIDCSASGGWIYFSSHIDDKYYKKSDCAIFDGKTYIGEAKYSGYYLRNGTWIANPGTAKVSISFAHGELIDYKGNMFQNTGCKKITDTSYKLGVRNATYNADRDSFTVKIGQVDGIDYGTVELTLAK